MRLSLATGIPYQQLVETDAHVLSTYIAVLEDIQRERRGKSLGDNAGL